MEHPVVAGVDGSPSGLQALDWAVDEAARHDRTLRLVHGSLWERYEAETPGARPGWATPSATGHDVLRAAEKHARHRQPGVAVKAEARPEDPVTALLREGEVASLIVVGSRGHATHPQAPLGSVGLGVAARATCPAVVVRGSQAARRGSHGRLVLALDGTARSLPAVRFAFEEARARRCPLVAVHAWPGPEAADATVEGPGSDTNGQLAARAMVEEALEATADVYGDVPVHREVVQDPPRRALLRAADHADLIVLGARPRHGGTGLHLGLVGHAVLHLAPCPVAVVPGTD